MARGFPLAALFAAIACSAVLPGIFGQDLGYISTVNVTVFVEGTLLVYVSHDDPKTYSREVPEPEPEYTYTLADEQREGDIAPAMLRIDFGDNAYSLMTGDIVMAPITLQLPGDLAEALGFNGRKGGDLGVYGRRRLLSEQHERARRMVLDFQNTRRSVQEFISVRDALAALKLASPASDIIRSGEPVIIGRAAPKDLFVANGQQQNISSLTFVFRSSSCGLLPALNASRVQQWWYDNGDKAEIVATFQRYHNVCTYNQVSFRREDNLVFDVDIPCTGDMWMGPYDLKNGMGNGKNLDNEIYGLFEMAKKHIQSTNATLYSQWSSFNRKIYIFPFNWYKGYAKFAGLASLGCTKNQECFTWLNPSRPTNSWLDMPVAFQELGHNIGLVHSSRWVCNAGSINCFRDEYGDSSDPMGSAVPIDRLKTLVCANAPQSFKAGWMKPVPGGHLNAFLDLKPGTPREFNLPAMALNKTNFLRIVTDTTNSVIDDSARQPQRALFVSYRVRQEAPGAFDSGLQDHINNRVWIHEYNQTANGAVANRLTPPTLLASLRLDETADASASAVNGFNRTFIQLVAGVGGIRIDFKGRNPQAAVVSLCRTLNQTTENTGGRSCADGLDNDCDGLVDMDDLDCNPGIASPRQLPPPSFRQPPSPSQSSPPLSRPPPPSPLPPPSPAKVSSSPPPQPSASPPPAKVSPPPPTVASPSPPKRKASPPSPAPLPPPPKASPSPPPKTYSSSPTKKFKPPPPKRSKLVNSPPPPKLRKKSPSKKG